MINGSGEVPLSAQLRRAVKLHLKSLREIAESIGVSQTQLYRFLDETRGLSQEKLDTLCSFLSLIVEGPPVTTWPRGLGVQPREERRIYRPKSAAQPIAEVLEKGQPNPPAHPPSLHLPAPDEKCEGS